MAANKALLVLLIALFLTVFLATNVLALEPYGPTYTGKLEVDSTFSKTITPGSKVMLSGSGFTPNAKYDILWDGKIAVDPYADKNGNISFEFTIPSNASPGIHTVSVQGAAAAGGTLVLSTSVDIKAKQTPKPALDKKSNVKYPFTGGDLLIYLSVAGAALVSIGFGMKIIRRSR